MTTQAASGRARRITPVMREAETVTPLELFFDLVFVLAFTQCTALMAAEPTFEGLAKGLLILGVLWWSWVGYAWLTSVLDPEEDAVRLVIFAAMAALLIVGLCVPEAFDDAALIFACAYAVVRIAHIALFMLASRDDPNLRSSVVYLAAVPRWRPACWSPRRSPITSCREPCGRWRSCSTWAARTFSASTAGGSFRTTSPSATR